VSSDFATTLSLPGHGRAPVDGPTVFAATIDSPSTRSPLAASWFPCLTEGSTNCWLALGVRLAKVIVIASSLLTASCPGSAVGSPRVFPSPCPRA
jgi:hypothetical protein